MLNIAILGGTFNPIHKGHIFMADKYNLTYKADFTLFIPTKLPPHKEIELGATDEDRLCMCELALQNRGNYIVSDIEYKRKGPSYTIDTLKTLMQLYASAKFTLIIGADMLINFNRWKKPDEILRIADVAVIPRKGTPMRQLENAVKDLNSNYGNDKVKIVGWSMLPISSSLIRDNLRKGKSLNNLVSSEVEAYIRKNRLYQL